jgi:hypothetical protein
MRKIIKGESHKGPIVAKIESELTKNGYRANQTGRMTANIQ